MITLHFRTFLRFLRCNLNLDYLYIDDFSVVDDEFVSKETESISLEGLEFEG